MEWLPFFTDPDPWQMFLGVLVLILGPTALLSERVVKEKFGAVGALFRWIMGRPRRRAEKEATTTERQIQDLKNEIQRVDNARKRDNERMTANINRLEAKTEHQHDYILWVTDKFRRVEMWAAEHGYVLPPPPFISFPEYMKQREEGRE